MLWKSNNGNGCGKRCRKLVGMSISCLSSKVPMSVRRPLAMPVQSRFKASHMAGTTSLPSSTGATKSAGWATLSARSSASMTSREVETITVPIMNTDIALITNALLCFLVATLPRGSDRVCRVACLAVCRVCVRPRVLHGCAPRAGPLGVPLANISTRI